MIYYLQTTTWNQYWNITAIDDLDTWIVMNKFYNEYIIYLHDEHYQELERDHDQDDSSVKNLQILKSHDISWNRLVPIIWSSYEIKPEDAVYTQSSLLRH